MLRELASSCEFLILYFNSLNMTYSLYDKNVEELSYISSSQSEFVGKSKCVAHSYFILKEYTQKLTIGNCTAFALRRFARKLCVRVEFVVDIDFAVNSNFDLHLAAVCVCQYYYNTTAVCNRATPNH